MLIWKAENCVSTILVTLNAIIPPHQLPQLLPVLEAPLIPGRPLMTIITAKGRRITMSVCLAHTVCQALAGASRAFFLWILPVAWIAGALMSLDFLGEPVVGPLCRWRIEGELSWEICRGVREGSRVQQEKKLSKDGVQLKSSLRQCHGECWAACDTIALWRKEAELFSLHTGWLLAVGQWKGVTRKMGSTSQVSLGEAGPHQIRTIVERRVQLLAANTYSYWGGWVCWTSKGDLGAAPTSYILLAPFYRWGNWCREVQ